MENIVLKVFLHYIDAEYTFSRYISLLFDVCRFNLTSSEYAQYLEQAAVDISDFGEERYMRLKVIIEHYLPCFYAEVSHLL